MNDPGLDEPISNDAEDIENRYQDGEQDAEDDQDTYLQPSRWWFASTAFPLIAGTFGPMASAFSICALVATWRVKFPPGGSESNGTSVKDPEWYVPIHIESLNAFY